MELTYLQIVAIVIISVAAGGIFTLFIVLTLNKSMSNNVSLKQIESDISKYVDTRKVKEPELDTGELMMNFVKPSNNGHSQIAVKPEISKKKKSIMQQLRELKSPNTPKVPTNNNGEGSLKSF